MTVFYAIAKFLTNVMIHIFYKMEYEGVENVPKGGGYMVCSNHRTNMDPIFIAQRLNTQLFFMAKQELFQNWFVRLIIKGLGAFPVERGKGDSGAIDFAVDTLKAGKVLAMFPEGSRSKDGIPQRPKSGAALVAMQTRANILPVGISFDLPLKFRSVVKVRYGEMIRFDSLGVETNAPREMKAVSKKIMGQIVELVDIPKDSRPLLTDGKSND